MEKWNSNKRKNKKKIRRRTKKNGESWISLVLLDFADFTKDLQWQDTCNDFWTFCYRILNFGACLVKVKWIKIHYLKSNKKNSLVVSCWLSSWFVEIVVVKFLINLLIYLYYQFVCVICVCYQMNNFNSFVTKTKTSRALSAKLKMAPLILIILMFL